MLNALSIAARTLVTLATIFATDTTKIRSPSTMSPTRMLQPSFRVPATLEQLTLIRGMQRSSFATKCTNIPLVGSLTLTTRDSLFSMTNTTRRMVLDLLQMGSPSPISGTSPTCARLFRLATTSLPFVASTTTNTFTKERHTRLVFFL